MLHFPVHVGTLDHTKIQVRPVDEPGLEDIDTFSIIQYAGNRRFGLIETKRLAFLRLINKRNVRLSLSKPM